MSFQSTMYRVIGASEKGDERVVEKYRLTDARKAANGMLADGLEVRLIKEVRSVVAIKKPGQVF